MLIVITALAAAGVLIYARFLLDPGNRGDLLPWLVVIAAEGVLVVHALFAMWTMLSATRDPRSYHYWATQERLYDPADPHRALALDGRKVGVEVFVTVYGEPVEVVRRTLEAALAIRGAHRTWLLDDGSSDDMRALADDLGCFYLRRLGSAGAKAGNINHALTQAKGDFFVVFDADFVPRPEFIEEVLPFFTDDNVAFVQTPQTYGNLHTMIARGAGYMQTRLLPLHPTRSQPLQRGVLRRHQRDVPTDRRAGDRRDLRRLQVRGRLDVAEAARAGLAQHLPRAHAGGRGRPRDHRGLHQAAAALGDRWLRDPAAQQPVLPAPEADAGPADHVRHHLDPLLHRDRAGAAAAGASDGDLPRPAPGGPQRRGVAVVRGLCRLLPDADPAGVRDARQLPLGGADAGGGLVPDLPARVDERVAAA